MNIKEKLKKTMTVGDLIKVLSKFPKDRKVLIKAYPKYDNCTIEIPLVQIYDNWNLSISKNLDEHVVLIYADWETDNDDYDACH